MRSPDEIARFCADAMWAEDSACQALDMRVLEVRAGYARMDMGVTEKMVNGHGTCHGGYIFTLADSAFAFACNNRNNLSVALDTSINFLKPVHVDDVLTAEATEIHNGRTTGLYQIRVINQHDHLVALFKGNCFRTGKPLI